MTWPLVLRSSYALVLAAARDAERQVTTLTARVDRAEELCDAIRAERIADREEAARRLDQSVAALHELLETERQARRDEREAAAKQYSELMTRFTQLRLQGAVDIPQPVPKAEPDMVKQAILAKCGTDRGRAQQMLRQLAVDRANHVDDMEIMTRIETGERDVFDGVPA